LEELVMPVLQFIAVLAATLFAGAAIYINVAEHPARMECGTAVAATVFGPSYRRAAVMQAALALVSTASAIGAWFMGAASEWLIGAVLIFAVVPFTLLVIMSTNKKVLDSGIDRSSDTVHRLLRRWGRLHAVRSVLALAASVVFLASLVSSTPRP
jgi:Anthrone oxygenase